MVWMDALLQHEDKTMLLTPFSSKSSATVRQPINEQITHLKNLYPKYVQSLVDQIQSASENPWVNYVQSLAHKSDSPDTPWAGSPLDEVLIQCMSALYTISRLTLDEVNSLEALTNQSEYSCQTFYLMGMFYHMIRGAPIWNQERATFVCSNPIPEGYAALFYERGTVQSCWRTLYNDYCERMETCAGTEQPKNLGVPIQWMQQDTNPQTFTPCTDRGFFTF
jgi:hypothetical protein